ncbi:MAG TPA: DUF481 domain-containing protein [Bryobacteraceae bacterium]|nr:DUF481 domain-containing protein [Bryobacteraceae bacterium]
MRIRRLNGCRSWLANGGLVWIALLAGGSLRAQTKPGPDVLLFNDGERLTGHFVKSSGTNVTFKSDALGDLTVDWSKVKELESSAKVAVIPKNVKLRKRSNASTIPQGTLTVQDQQVHLAPAPAGTPQSIPLAGTGEIVDQAAFQKALTHQPGFFEAWKGTITIGGSLVNATQDSESFTGAVSLVRAIPTEDWLEPRDKTIVNLTESYGEVTQPATPSIRTSIFHGSIERDEFLSPRLFAFGQGAFDHNYSQGLDLQQTYSGGIGYTILQRANETLDVKGSASYVRQQFENSTDLNLIGSIFGEDFNRKFKRGLILDQHLTFTPAWNDTSAYAAAFNALLTMPVYKRINGSAGFIDSYLNNPPPAFRKNSVQVTIGLTYALP